MGGMGKYYCDYCDKQFQDTPLARKRHLQSSSHLRAKSLWFNAHTTTSIITPPNNHQLNSTATTIGSGNGQSQIIPGSQLVGGSSLLTGVAVRDSMQMSWGSLPPSLKPPPEGGYPPLPFVDWG